MPTVRVPDDPVWDDVRMVAEIDGVPIGHVILQAAREYMRVQVAAKLREQIRQAERQLVSAGS